MTVIGLAAPVLVLVTPPFEETHEAVKLVIGEPLFIGAANVTLSDPDATWTAVGTPGCPGAPAISAGDVLAESGPQPTALRAAMANWYDTPSVRPVRNRLVAAELNVWTGCATPAL